jgi:hypothetical protein
MDKNSMFKSSIIQHLDKSLNIKQEILPQIFSVLLTKYPQFFRVIEHKNGEILQIQIKLYNQIRSAIEQTSNDE